MLIHLALFFKPNRSELVIMITTQITEIYQLKQLTPKKLKLLEMNIDGKLNFEHKPWVNNNQKLCLCKFEHFSF